MEEEYSPNWGIEMGMRNTLDCGTMSGKISSSQSPPRPIDICISLYKKAFLFCEKIN
jgi:hypothetical protein